MKLVLSRLALAELDDILRYLSADYASLIRPTLLRARHDDRQKRHSRTQRPHSMVTTYGVRGNDA